MGLILLPILVFWLGMALYILHASYEVLASLSSYIEMFGFGSALGISYACYLYWGFSRFKTRTKLAWYDIPLFFTTHKPSLFTFTLMLIIHSTGLMQWRSAYLQLVPIIMLFAISLGVLSAIFFAPQYMKRKGIQQIH